MSPLPVAIAFIPMCFFWMQNRCVSVQVDAAPSLSEASFTILSESGSGCPAHPTTTTPGPLFFRPHCSTTEFTQHSSPP
jgi:hypothetical protein